VIFNILLICLLYNKLIECSVHVHVILLLCATIIGIVACFNLLKILFHLQSEFLGEVVRFLLPFIVVLQFASLMVDIFGQNSYCYM